MRYFFAGIALQVSVLASSAVIAADADLQAVFIKDGEIFTLEGNHPHQITNDGVAKSLPVWSKDGKKIAFSQLADPQLAIGVLRVIDQSGDTIATIPIAPRNSEIKYSIRGVETIEWLSDRKIAISGTVNPSTTENQIIDISSGSVLQNFFDDGYGASYSADGRHFAYVGGAPHFAARNTWEPNLLIDNRRVFPPPGVRVRFLNAPQWSPQGNTLAIIAQYLESKEQTLITWRPRQKLHVETLHNTDLSSTPLCWQNEDIIVNTTTSICPDGMVGVQGVGAVNRSENLAKTMAEAQVAIASNSGAQADFWCAACELSILPRKADINSISDPNIN